VSDTSHDQPPVDSTTALARHLGLSRWTISRVLNGHPGIKTETRERVLQAMELLGFTPNPMARGLRGSQTRMVGICFQELHSPALARKIAILQNLLREKGYRALLELTDGNPSLEEEVIRHFMSIKVDGIVLTGSTLHANNPLVHQLTANKASVIAVDPLHQLPFSTVMLDRHWAMRLKMEHLHALGHHKFALLGFDPSVVYGNIRLEGIQREAKRLGLAYEQDFFRLLIPGENHQDYHYGWKLAEKFLSEKCPATAIVALSDQIAIGAIKYLREAGYQVPHDYSVIGFDNLDVAAFSHPTLTTVDQQISQIMSTTVEQLLKLIQNANAQPEMQIIRPVIKVRASTGPAHPARTQ
jgi:DNA-binding LacI/PurR family transcriptional regulator